MSRQITRPFPYNGFYPADDAPEINAPDWKLEVSGLVEDRTPWTLERLRPLPQEGQITALFASRAGARSAPGAASATRLPRRIGADTKADMSGSNAPTAIRELDMPSALHPQTILAMDSPGSRSRQSLAFP